MRPRAAITHTSSATLAVAADPASSGAHRDLKPFGSAPQRPTIIDDATSQPQTTGFLQRGITVNHEDLRSELVRS